MSENTQTPNTGPLKGLRILDLTRILAGPSCTQVLGDLGADVFKIEKPEMGDDTRGWGPPFVKDKAGNNTSESAYYLAANRNKRSIALDIAASEDVAKLKDLLRTCDVLIENFKVGGLEKYGLSYEQLEKEFPQLVYCSITGFGQTGPNAHKAGYDLLIQGWGGLMSLTGEADREPVKVAVAIVDLMAGMYASTSILAALRHVDKTGEGQQIDLALADIQVAWLANLASNYLISGNEPARHGNQHANIVPYQVFEVADGHIIVAVGNDAQFARFCEILNAPELAVGAFATNSGRLAGREALIPELQRLMVLHKKSDLIAKMEELGIPGGPINTIPEVFETEQVTARDMKIDMPYSLAGSGLVPMVGSPIKLSKTPVSYRHAPPVLGADTKRILDDLKK
jgi:crotonobetainyl-CoA:carnitine CoA-transferase CaiB-like acyl-CoA transferase